MEKEDEPTDKPLKRERSPSPTESSADVAPNAARTNIRVCMDQAAKEWTVFVFDDVVIDSGSEQTFIPESYEEQIKKGGFE